MDSIPDNPKTNARDNHLNNDNENSQLSMALLAVALGAALFGFVWGMIVQSHLDALKYSEYCGFIFR